MKDKKYCEGCGVLLQDENILQEGYTTNLENDLCQRCFRMKNYGEYQTEHRQSIELCFKRADYGPGARSKKGTGRLGRG